MAGKDEERGRKLAEAARLFLLWKQENELPGLEELSKVQPKDTRMLAGVYRRVEVGQGSTRPVPWGTDDPDIRRMLGLNKGLSHALLFGPDERVKDATYGFVRCNQVVPVAGMELDQTGALQVMAPRLDSLTADADTLARREYIDFVSVIERADLVWDDHRSAPKGFKYSWIFDYDIPRPGYERNVHAIDPPDQIQHQSGYEEERRYKAFIDYLRQYATYRPRRTRADEDGDYYKKWKAASPRKRSQREFKPALLSKDYIDDCLLMPILKRSEDYMFLDVGWRWCIYHLKSERGSRPADTFTVELKWVATGPVKPDAEHEIGVLNGVVFHALEGADRMPGLPDRGTPEHYRQPSGRFTVDYKAQVQWYFDDKDLDLRDDATWFNIFVDTFFGDAVYPIKVGKSDKILRERLLASLKAQIAEAEGALKQTLEDMLAEYERDGTVAFLVQGEEVGGREIIGVTYDDQNYAREVFEWNPRTHQVTRMQVFTWRYDFSMGEFAREVYRNTAGMIPLMMLITWGAVGVMGAAIIAPGALSMLARETVRYLATEFASRKITKEALRRVGPQFAAAIVEGLLALLPKSDALPIVFVRGLLHGFGTGTVITYLTEADKRLQHAARTLYKGVVNRLTKGVYRAFMVYEKVSAAVRKLQGLYKALKTVWTDERAKIVAEQLNKLGHHVGLAFIIILFVVIYLDFVYRRKNKRDEWMKKQRDALVWMIRNTGDDIATYAKELHDELIGNKLTPDEVRARNEKLSAKLTGAARAGVAAIPAVADILQSMLKEMGIDNWDELKSKGFLELLSEGFDALLTLHPELKAEGARVLGEAIGELIGGITLGRKMVPEEIRKNVGLIRGYPHHRALKQALDDGTLRGLWRLALAPIRELHKLVPRVVQSVHKISSEHQDVFEKVRDETSYAGFLDDLMDDYGDVVAMLAKLAMDEGLADQIKALVERAGVEPDQMPNIDDLLKTDDPRWPRTAVLFVLGTWLQLGLRQLLDAFAVIEDDKIFGGQFRLAQILEILGLDVALDDDIVTALKTTFSRST
jgi:hypothetical protein